jgi:4'-phosphopantetheinyl transferase
MNTTILPAALRSLGSTLGIDLWLARLDEAGEILDAGMLSAAERARAERFAFDHDRQRYIAAHFALRQLLAMRTGEALTQLRFENGAHGKPRVCGGGCAFSLSHSAQYALIALSDTGDIGADIEVVKTMPDAERLAERLYTPTERTEIAGDEDAPRAFLRCWTRKEACLKAVGRGLSIEPGTFEAGTTAQQRTLSIPIDASSLVVAVASVETAADCVAAVARALP